MPLEILPAPEVAISYAVLIPVSEMMLHGHTKCSGPAILHPPQLKPSTSEPEQGLWSKLCLQSMLSWVLRHAPARALPEQPGLQVDPQAKPAAPAWLRLLPLTGFGTHSSPGHTPVATQPRPREHPLH